MARLIIPDSFEDALSTPAFWANFFAWRAAPRAFGLSEAELEEPSYNAWLFGHLWPRWFKDPNRPSADTLVERYLPRDHPAFEGEVAWLDGRVVDPDLPRVRRLEAALGEHVWRADFQPWPGVEHTLLLRDGTAIRMGIASSDHTTPVLRTSELRQILPWLSGARQSWARLLPLAVWWPEPGEAVGELVQEVLEASGVITKARVPMLVETLTRGRVAWGGDFCQIEESLRGPPSSSFPRWSLDERRRFAKLLKLP